MEIKKRIYLIGFDLSGGLGLHRYFVDNGYNCTFGDEDGFSSSALNNYQNGLPLINGFESCQFFTQIQHEDKNGDFIYTHERVLDTLLEEQPNALFIFNYLPVEGWLEQRANCYGYLPKATKALNLNEAQVLEHWRAYYLAYYEKVVSRLKGAQNYFAYNHSSDCVLELTRFLARHDIILNLAAYEPISEIRGSTEQRFHVKNIREAALYFRYHRFDIDTAINLLQEAEKHQPCRYYFKDELKKWKLEKKTWKSE
ncbi:hypothetical protein [Pseudoalteromonas luteoviolacea]|uniref:Uncharacterized protein n=1 Tax=Pseudoalteromonas luteoviolacea NCIMB 1942 TaxID=1365253 RepID=A0A167I0V8_9GAMM|nr:hypothetical protein [Pseudoalteromonas luteoviolacea]KZN58765.1 hypothetical protein N482_21410 [Pseudoalteromonas luteoviolacea NCIMB 1942]KZX00375.1 hypothetical protein JL49_11605 [Pseudoalteromonas luteoviolacea]